MLMGLHTLRPTAPGAPAPGQPALTTGEAAMAEAVEVFHRTYTTLLRSSGETKLRVLEASHRAMGSSLHSLAESHQPDLGAFLYAIRRLPDSLGSAERIVMGQSAEVFSRAGYSDLSQWEELRAPGRRRRWYCDGRGTLAVLIASASDVDDLVPTLVAYQIEWNKIGETLRAAALDLGSSLPANVLTESCGGDEDDWVQLAEVWGADFASRLQRIVERRLSLRIRMLGGTQVGYARATRRWWQQVTGMMRSESLLDRPVYFVSSNSHSLANLVTGMSRDHEESLVSMVEQMVTGLIVDDQYANHSALLSWTARST